VQPGEILAPTLDPAGIFDALMIPDLKLQKVAGLLLVFIPTIDQPTQNPCVTGADQQQTLFLFFFAGMAGTIGQYHSIAANVVSKLG
jgi:hypothetical protein